MGERIALAVRILLRERKIVRSRISRGMVLKELEVSKNDLEAGRRSLNEEDYKWATVQAYYSIFHAAKALLYNRGFREKSHRGLLAALRQLYPREIPGSMLDDFREAMELRESADYGLVWSEESATNVLDAAEAFLDKAKSILRQPPRRRERSRGSELDED